MRVATYTERSAPSHGSMLALGALVLTILLGTGVMPVILGFIGGPVELIVTPLWLLLYAAALLGLMFGHGINWISWLVRYRILLVVLMLGTMVSVSWSIDARVSAERTVHLIGSSLLAVYIGFTVPLLTTLRVFAVILALAILASIGAAVGLPELGIEAYEGIEVWRGVFNSKNALGFWAAVGVLLYITLSDSTESIFLKLLCFLMAGLCLGALALSQSATSLLALIIAGALSLYFFIAGRFHLGFFRMAFMALLFTAVIALAIANINTAELVGRTGDLTGRGEVWAQVWKLILQHPLTGVGYGSLWFPTDATIWIQQSLFDFTWVVYHAHNGLLQIASEIGLPLTVIALLMVVQQLIEIFYCQYERQQVGVLFVLGFVAAYLVSNYSEARFLVTRELFWIFFVALPISMLRQINLVLPDTQSEDAEDARGFARGSGVNVRAPQGAATYKPWLEPLPHELEPPASPVGKAVPGSVAALMSYAEDRDGNSKPPGPANDEDMDHTLTATADLDDTSGTLSQEKTDIDLGVLDLTIGDVDVLLDESGEMSDADVLEAMRDDIIDRQTPIEHDGMRYDDTLDVDRFDKDFDETGEWEAIDSDDKR